MIKTLTFCGLLAALTMGTSSSPYAASKKGPKQACSFQKCYSAVIAAGRAPGLAARICRDKGCK